MCRGPRMAQLLIPTLPKLVLLEVPGVERKSPESLDLLSVLDPALWESHQD